MTLAFRAQSDLLEGFEQDSGFQPAGSPAAIRVVAGANAALVATASAMASGDTLTPVAGSGSLSMEAGFSLEISARIDAAGVEYEGVVETFEYGIDPATTMFEPFAIGETVTLETALPPGELARVPVPSVPGATLIVDIAGGQVNTAYSGTCAAAIGGAAQYTGEAVIDGTLQLEGTIEIELLVTSETFGPFAFEVPIPASTTELDLGTFSVSDGMPTEGSPCDGAGSDTDTSGTTAASGESTRGDPTAGEGSETGDEGSTGCDMPGGCEPQCVHNSDCLIGTCNGGQCGPPQAAFCEPVYLVIPDAGRAVTSSVIVPEGGTVDDVSIGVASTHARIEDLTISVEHNGTAVRVYNQECAKDKTNLLFDDSAAPLDCAALGSKEPSTDRWPTPGQTRLARSPVGPRPYSSIPAFSHFISPKRSRTVVRSTDSWSSVITSPGAKKARSASASSQRPVTTSEANPQGPVAASWYTLVRTPSRVAAAHIMRASCPPPRIATCPAMAGSLTVPGPGIKSPSQGPWCILAAPSARVVKPVGTGDLKSPSFGSAGSSPAPGTFL